MGEENKESRSQKSRMNVNDIARKATKGSKVAGIIIAILMVVLGILFWARPLGTVIAVQWFAALGFAIYGVFLIVMFFRTASEERNGWTLANGIIFALVGILLTVPSGYGALADVESRMFVFAFLLGFMALSSGITMCTSYGVFKKSGEPGAGWILASGIINLILGFFIIVSPFAFTWVLAFLLGIYLVIGGIALFAEACSGKLAKK